MPQMSEGEGDVLWRSSASGFRMSLRRNGPSCLIREVWGMDNDNKFCWGLQCCFAWCQSSTSCWYHWVLLVPHNAVLSYRANAAHAAMQDPQKVYSTWMIEYLNKKTEGCSLSQSLPRTSTSKAWWWSAMEISDKLSVQITKGQWWNNNTENSYWQSYMLMLLPEATAHALPLLTCNRCMPCNIKSALRPLHA
jgi:hypothetical protein